MQALARLGSGTAPGLSTFPLHVRLSFEPRPFPARAVRRYHKALLIALACGLLVAAGLVRAYIAAPRSLTSAEVLAATRVAVREAVDAAVARRGLSDAEAFVASAIADDLRRQGFGGALVHLVRPNDLNPWAAFYFVVNASGLAVRFDLEGTRDPLLAIPLGRDVPIRQDPDHPYTTHAKPGVLAACLAYRYYHVAPEGPDFFARLENRTRDPYHFGFETFVRDGSRLAVDHTFLETGTWGLNDEERARYGL